MRRYTLLLGLVLSSFVAPALGHAQQSKGFSLDRFRPAPTTEDGLAVALPRTLGHLRPGASLTLDYAHQPLVLSKVDQDATGAIVKHRLVGHLMGALGIGERGEVFVHAPVTFVQGGDDPQVAGVAFPDPKSASLGDLAIGASVRALGGDRDPMQVGLMGALTLPTGDADSLSGDDGVRGDLSLLLAYHLQAWTLAGNVGGRYRPSADYGSTGLGTEALFSGGAYYRITDRLIALGEANGSTTFRNSQAFKSEGTPLELLLGARWSSPIKLVLTGAMGVGLTQAVGVPDVRVIAQLGYPPPRPPLQPPDRDHDGIEDDDDRCPDDAEDMDGFEDEDGCPDPDNDHDGVGDGEDACPLDAEDIDGFEDEDGCPDLDNDEDGLADEKDRCPNNAEDIDAFEDEDGCPDLDNDQDGILDATDQCPMKPEDLDGFEDKDGCPDPDNDKDGVLDQDDNCPTAPGPAETKGCPSAVRIDRSQIRILERVEFETNRAEIRPESLGILDQVRSALEVNPQIKKIRVEGHTDSRGPDARNLTLSQRRAESVMQYLVNEGIAPDRLEAKGWGEEKPLEPNDSPDHMQTNRRVEFHIVDPAPPENEDGADGPSASPPTKPSADDLGGL